MALQKQTMVIPIAGLDTHADPKSAVPGTLVQAENVWFKRTARGGELRKRFGVTARTRNIFGGGATAVGRRLGTFRGEQLMADDKTLYSWSSVLSLWKAQGVAAHVSIVAETVNAGAASESHGDVAVSGNLMCFVSLVGGLRSQVTVIDLATGVRLLNEGLTTSAAIGATSRTRVVALASKFMIFNASPTNTKLMARDISYATPSTISGETQVLNVLGTTGNFDVIRNGALDSALVAYHSTNANKLEILLWNSNNTAGATVGNTDVPDQCLGWLTWDMSDNLAYLAYDGAVAGAKQLTISQTPTISATTTIDAALVATQRTTGFRLAGVSTVFFEVAGAVNAFDALIKQWPGSGVTTTVWQRSLGIAAKVFVLGGRPYLPATYSSAFPTMATQTGYFVLDASAAGPRPPVVASALFGQATGLTSAGVIVSCAAISSTKTAIPCCRLAQPATVSNSSGVQANYLTFDSSGSGVGGLKQVNDAIHVPGGRVTLYDGALTTEVGFHVFPEPPYNVVQAAGGSLTTTNAYGLCAVYSILDNRGQIYRSAPSTPISVLLTGANQQITVDISTYRMGAHPALQSVSAAFTTGFVELYATVGNGSTFFKVATLNNDPTVDKVTTTFSQADATTSTGQLLYTTGGALPHIPLAPAQVIEAWRGRLFMAGTELPTELWVSDEVVPGEGVSFSDLNVIVMEQEGGAITALAEMDDRLVIFKRSSIYQLAGQGPAANGDGQFEQPARLTAVIGALGPAGVVKMPQGVIFKSARGFYLLPRGGMQPVRLPGVEAYESLTLTGAVVLDDREQVRFTHAEGRTLVYHFGHLDEQGIGRWTTFTGQAAVDTMVWAGQWVYLAADGTVQVEVANQFNDNGAAIQELVQWAEIRPADLFGRCRIYNVRYLVDLLASFTITSTLLESMSGATSTQVDAVAVTAATPIPVGARPVMGQLEAFQATLQESSLTEGFRVSALGLEVGVKPGAAKLIPGQSLS